MKASDTFTLVILLLIVSTFPSFTSDQDEKLLEAAADGRTDAIGALLEEGADVDARAGGSKTPLLLAAEKGHTEAVRKLLAAGAQVNWQDQSGGTALTLAAWNRHLDIVRLLVEADADVNIADLNGDTALMYATMSGDLNAAKILISAGADPETQDRFGRTPFYVARKNKHNELVHLMETRIRENRNRARHAQNLLAGGADAVNTFRYREAIDLLLAAARIDETLGAKRKMNLGHEWYLLGKCYTQLGQFDKALEYLQRALSLEIGLALESSIELDLLMADVKTGLGEVYEAWALYDKAFFSYKKALDLYKKYKQERMMAETLDSMGRIYQALGRLDKALKYYEQALAINEQFDTSQVGITSVKIGTKEVGHYSSIGERLEKIGTVYLAQKQYERALGYFRRALERAEKSKQRQNEAIALNSLGDFFRLTGKYSEALGYYLQALAINDELGFEDGVATNLSDLGVTCYQLGEYDKAASYFCKAIDIKEELRLTASGAVRRDYLSSQISTYQWLTETYVEFGKAEKAFDAIELSRAKYMVEQMRFRTGREGFDFAGIASYRKTLARSSALICYANMEQSEPCLIYVDRNTVQSMKIDLQGFLSETEDFAGELDSDQPGVRGFSLVKKPEQGEMPTDEVTGMELEKIVNYYRLLLMNWNPNKKEIEARNAVGKALYRFLLRDLGPLLEGKDSLTIIPDGILAFLPFETIILPDGRYLVEQFNIKYTQSLSVSDLINKRRYSDERKPMLAFGGAIYNEVSYSSDMVRSAKQLEYLENDVLDSMEEGKGLGNAFFALGMASFTNLPGTLEEVKAIERIVPASKISTAEEASESRIKSMSKDGKLKQYKVLHFATHGVVVPEMPKLSALVLGQFKEEPGFEDGFLNMREISELELNADFVNLSACETGLGRVYGGEGVVGLTQAFLVAGANALSVSLWQVADESTMEFMTGLYRWVQDEKLSYDEAITRMKRAFIQDARYSNPFYWAPFVYYGK